MIETTAPDAEAHGGIPDYLWPEDGLADLTGEDRVTALAQEVYVIADALQELTGLVEKLHARVNMLMAVVP